MGLKTALYVVVLAGAFVAGRMSNAPPTSIPFASDEDIVTSLCVDLNNSGGGHSLTNHDPNYTSFIRPAVYVVSQDLPDPFDFYTIAPEVRLSVKHLVRQGVLSEQGLDEIGQRRHTLGLLSLLGSNSDWSIDSSDFAHYLVESISAPTPPIAEVDNLVGGSTYLR